MAYGLTKDQQRCLNFIRNEIAAGNSPSFEEIRVGLGYKSTSSAQRLVHGLIDRGCVFMAGDRIKRSLTLTEPLGACPHCGLRLYKTPIFTDILQAISRLRARLSPDVRHLSNDSAGMPIGRLAAGSNALPGGDTGQRSGGPKGLDRKTGNGGVTVG